MPWLLFTATGSPVVLFFASWFARNVPKDEIGSRITIVNIIRNEYIHGIFLSSLGGLVHVNVQYSPVLVAFPNDDFPNFLKSKRKVEDPGNVILVESRCSGGTRC